jgi:hypothetical protein
MVWIVYQRCSNGRNDCSNTRGFNKFFPDREPTKHVQKSSRKDSGNGEASFRDDNGTNGQEYRAAEAENETDDRGQLPSGYIRKVIFEYAGIVGVHSAEFSLRELSQMVKGKKSHDWDLFASLICVTANIWLPKDKTLTVDKIHPFGNEKKYKPKTRPFNYSIWTSLLDNLPKPIKTKKTK